MRATGMIAIGWLLVGAASPPVVTGVRPIPLHDGVNRVPGFLPGGGTATIVQGWVGNGNAHGHYSWMVLGGPSEGKAAGIVVFANASPAGDSDIIGASPFDGERVTGDVRFATGRIDGRPVSLAIKGVLDWPPSGIIADHATATIIWYRLIHDASGGIGPTDRFAVIGRVRSAARYCNVDLALRDMAHLPLPAGFAGANRIDGCFARGG